MRLKKSSFWSKIPNWVWLLISLAVALVLWLILSQTASSVFATPAMTVQKFIAKMQDGTLPAHIGASCFV